MKPILFRSLGYAVPTVALITLSHVERDPRFGEWIDGIVSGAWFAACFLVAALAAAAAARHRMGHVGGSPAAELAYGTATGVITWLAVWAFWQLPGTATFRPQAFAANSAAMVLAALAAAAVFRPRARGAYAGRV